jgi:hypothetical protein
MSKKNLANKFWVVMSIVLILISPLADSFARDGDMGRGRGGERREGRDRGREHEFVVVGHERYHYRDGRFFRPWFFGLEFAVAVPPIGAVVTSIPIGRRTIIVAGVNYYYYNDIYYRDYPNGYIVVSAPQPAPAVVVVPPAAAQYGQTVTINIPNSNGSYTPVTLQKRDNGYVGPQGEFYPDQPTVEQLRALYGR